jgi:hypothetical protein
MTTIKIDYIDFGINKLSYEDGAQLISLQFCDQELQRLQAQSAALQTARMPMPKPCNQRFLPCLQVTRLNSTDARLDDPAGVLTWSTS